MTWLRRIALALAVLVLPAGAACAFLLGTPMEVVLPLRSMLTLCALAVLVLAAAAWWLKPAKRLLPAAVGLAGAVLAMAAATAILRAPACEDFTVDSGGTKLAGTACMPADNTPVPVAVFVHGSGPATRSEFRFYAETLARRGIAAVTYDKRGAGRSGGDTYEGGYDLYAQDLAAVSAWAAVQSFARPDTLGLVGFSEAEWVMPLAAPAVDPAYIAVVGASALSPHDQVSEEIEIRLGRAGYDDTAVRAAVAVNDALADYLRGALSPEDFGSVLAEAQRQPWFDVAQDLPDKVYPREAYAWWASVMETSPGAWSGYAGPVLFIKGSADDRSDADRALKRFRDLRPAHGSMLDARIIEGADHMILLWPRGERTPPPAFPAGYPDLIADWILEVSQR